MASIEVAAKEFLAQRRFAVVGATDTKASPGNAIFLKLLNAGATVFAVNPKRQTVAGRPCYPNLKSLPEPVDGIVIVTPPHVTEQVVRECAETGVPRVWIHQSLKAIGSSVSESAVQFCRDHHIAVIAGGCPMMFCEPVDAAHKCMRWLSRVTGNLPAEVV